MGRLLRECHICYVRLVFSGKTIRSAETGGGAFGISGEGRLSPPSAAISGGDPMANTRKIGRDARTGEFIPVKVAQTRKSTSVVETIKVPPKPKKK